MLKTFLEHYLAPTGGIHLVAIDDSGVSGQDFQQDSASAESWARAQNVAGKNVYFSVAVIRTGVNTKPGKSDVTHARWAHLDIDPDGPEWNKQAALADLQMRGQPSFVIDSGNGLQGFWALDRHLSGEAVEAVNKGLAAAFQADHCWNCDRLMRLPGLTNWPNAKKREAGRVPVQSDLIAPFSGAAVCPDSLLQRFPAPVEQSPGVEVLPSGPDPRWTLQDATDAEIIKLMLSERPSMSASFGDGPTILDLWEGTEKALEHYKGDASALDMALLAKIAFYAGRDASRIKSIFDQSELGKREKWIKREDYRNLSIARVVANCQNVYSVDRSAPAPALDGEIVPSGEFLTVYEQDVYFKGCVYVADRHEVLIPSGEFLKPSSFKALYGGHRFEIGTETQPATDAFEAFTLNRLKKFPKALTTMFEPEMDFGYMEDGKVNIYRPDPSVKATEGDVSRFLNHLEKMLPDAKDREILLTYLAAVVQNPGVKFQWAPFIQGVQGNGKSMIGEILKRAVGPMYVHEPFSDDLANKFNDWLDSKLLIIVEELSLGERVEIENNIKTWVTSRMVEMQAKGGKKTMRPNRSNWIIFSNFQNALPIDANQRRYAPFFTAQQSGEDINRDFPEGYFPKLWEWLDNGGYECLTYYLRNRPLDPEFNPAGTGQAAARAPHTSSTAKAITSSRGRFEQEVLEAVESAKPGFRSPWISSTAITNLTKDLRLRMGPVRVRSALESLGYVQWGRSTQIIMSEGGAKPVLYVLKGNEDLTVNDFISAQGYAA